MSVLDPLPAAGPVATIPTPSPAHPVDRGRQRRGTARARRSLPHPIDRHGTLDEAVHRAVRRDLGRLLQVLAAPVTTVRRAAVVRHIEFLVTRLLAHHAGEDRRWHRVCARRPDLAGRAAAARSGHRTVRQVGQDVLSAARTWAVDGDVAARTALHRRVHELADLTVEQFHADECDRVLLTDELTVADFQDRPIPRIDPSGRRPALIAHEVFWLVDDLDASLAARIVEQYSRPTRWALRNLFSGGYNRAAHLMWVGGGDGPAT